MPDRDRPRMLLEWARRAPLPRATLDLRRPADALSIVLNGDDGSGEFAEISIRRPASRDEPTDAGWAHGCAKVMEQRIGALAGHLLLESVVCQPSRFGSRIILDLREEGAARLRAALPDLVRRAITADEWSAALRGAAAQVRRIGPDQRTRAIRSAVTTSLFEAGTANRRDSAALGLEVRLTPVVEINRRWTELVDRQELLLATREPAPPAPPTCRNLPGSAFAIPVPPPVGGDEITMLPVAGAADVGVAIAVPLTVPGRVGAEFRAILEATLTSPLDHSLQSLQREVEGVTYGLSATFAEFEGRTVLLLTASCRASDVGAVVAGMVRHCTSSPADPPDTILRAAQGGLSRRFADGDTLVSLVSAAWQHGESDVAVVRDELVLTPDKLVRVLHGWAGWFQREHVAIALHGDVHQLDPAAIAARASAAGQTG